MSDGPIAIGGGMIRHYTSAKNARTSVRYSYEGTNADTILIEKFTRSDMDGSTRKELIKVPTGNLSEKKEATFQVGSHNIKLKLNRYDRVIIEEIK